MRQTTYVRLLPTLLFVLGSFSAHSQNPVYSVPVRPQTAKVTIMALGISAHHGYAGNQEIYLADIQIKGKDHVIAKLVDTYPPTETPIRRSLLTERHLFQMTLVRNAECDTTGQHFFLSKDEANFFDAGTRDALKDHATESIPCFTVTHDATRLAK